MKDFTTLKKYILEKENIAEAINYFFDLLEQNRKVDSKPQQVEDINDHPELGLALYTAVIGASDILKRKVEIVEKIIIEIAHEKFYHGYCILSDTAIPMLILYCSEYQLGVAALGKVLGKTEYFRFSLSIVSDSKSVH